MNTTNNLTYSELFETLRVLSPEQMKMNVTIYRRGDDGFYPARSVNVSDGSDEVLDNNHPYIVIQ